MRYTRVGRNVLVTHTRRPWSSLGKEYRRRKRRLAHAARRKARP